MRVGCGIGKRRVQMGDTDLRVQKRGVGCREPGIRSFLESSSGGGRGKAGRTEAPGIERKSGRVGGL